MKNWKDYIGFQPYVEPTKKEGESDEQFEERVSPTTDFPGVPVFVLTVKKSSEKTFSISIEKQLINVESFTYNEDEIGSAIESIIAEFPIYENWEKFNGVNKKTWHFGFGPYYKNVDGNMVYHKNSISIPWPVFNIQPDYFAMRKLRKEVTEDLEKLTDDQFNEKYNDVPMDVMLRLTEYTTSFLGRCKKNIPLPYICSETTEDKFNILQWERMRNQIAKQSRRGMGNTRVKIENLSVMYYNGNTQYDRPIIVSEYNGKYAIIKHPDFEKYGYMVNNESL